MARASDRPSVSVLPSRMPAGHRIGNAADLRHLHLAELLWFLRAHGPCSRLQIARGCGFGLSTMTELVAELKARRLIKELDPVRGVGAGRPMLPIALDGEPWCVLGVQIDSDRVITASVTLGGKLTRLRIEPISLDGADPEVAVGQVARVLARHVSDLPSDRRVVAACFAVPGVVINRGAGLHHANRLPWNGMGVREWMADALAEAGVTGVHVEVASDGQLEGLHAVRTELRLAPAETAI